MVCELSVHVEICCCPTGNITALSAIAELLLTIGRLWQCADDDGIDHSQTLRVAATAAESGAGDHGQRIVQRTVSGESTLNLATAGTGVGGPEPMHVCK